MAVGGKIQLPLPGRLENRSQITPQILKCIILFRCPDLVAAGEILIISMHFTGGINGNNQNHPPGDSKEGIQGESYPCRLRGRPGFAAQKTQEFFPPTDFDRAMAWLEGYRHLIKRARLEFKDGSRIYFYGREFERYEPKRSFDGKEAK